MSASGVWRLSRWTIREVPKGHFLFIYISELFVFIGVELINNVVIVSGEQGRDLVIHIHVSILPQTPLPSRLPHNTEQSSCAIQ